jgi:hypothetical protein
MPSRNDDPPREIVHAIEVEQDGKRLAWTEDDAVYWLAPDGAWRFLGYLEYDDALDDPEAQLREYLGRKA